MQTEQLNELRQKAIQMERDMKKMLGTQMSKLSEVLKQVEYGEAKKGKVNKKSASIFLAKDNSHVKIYFDNKEDNVKLFEGIK